MQQIKKNSLGRGTAPFPDPSREEGGTPLRKPYPLVAFGASILASFSRTGLRYKYHPGYISTAAIKQSLISFRTDAMINSWTPLVSTPATG